MATGLAVGSDSAIALRFKVEFSKLTSFAEDWGKLHPVTATTAAYAIALSTFPDLGFEFIATHPRITAGLFRIVTIEIWNFHHPVG